MHRDHQMWSFKCTGHIKLQAPPEPSNHRSVLVEEMKVTHGGPIVEPETSAALLCVRCLKFSYLRDSNGA